MNHPQLMLVTCKRNALPEQADTTARRAAWASAEADLTPAMPRSPAKQTDESTRV